MLGRVSRNISVGENDHLCSQLAEMPIKDLAKYAQARVLIENCISGLRDVAEVQALRNAGLAVNALLFHADEDYRREIVYRMAR